LILVSHLLDCLLHCGIYIGVEYPGNRIECEVFVVHLPPSHAMLEVIVQYLPIYLPTIVRKYLK
jgi:hypothetical protein